MPLAAHGRPLLMKSIRRRLPASGISSRCIVTSVFDAGEGRGVMCQVEFGGAAKSIVLVAPIEHLSFHTRNVVAWDITRLLERRSRKPTRPGNRDRYAMLDGA